MSRFNRALQFGSVLQAAVAAAVAAVMQTAIAVRNANVRKLAHHRQIDFTAPLVARYGKSTECRAMIAFAAAEELMALRFPNFALILRDQLQRRLGPSPSPRREG